MKKKAENKPAVPGVPDIKRILGFGLRLKITLTFFVISALVGGLISWSSYRVLDDQLFLELQGKVLNLTKIGSMMIDQAALGRLVAVLRDGEDEAKTAAIEEGADYRKISAQLNAIRSTDARLIRYTYLFVPTADPDHARYVVDADVLDLLARKAKGEKVSDDDISRFGSDFDVSEFPVAKSSMSSVKSEVEHAYSWDDTFKVNSVSGYSPVLGSDGKPLAWLGLDMTDKDVKASLVRATTLSLAITGMALVLSLIASIVLGLLFTKGIIYLDRIVHRFGERDFGARAEVKTRDEVGRLSLSFNQMAHTIQLYSAQLQDLLDAYARFVPQDFLKFLEKGSIVDVRLGDQVRREMTVLFSDIRQFSTLSETMSPEENFNFLNSYLKRIGPEIRNHSGFIDKYIGDAIMALFPSNPKDAIDSAIAMMRSVRAYNADRAKSGYQPIAIGIGINLGWLMLGTLGEDQRMDGSVISDAVNLSSRLEGLTKYYGASILTTDATLRRVEGSASFRARLIDRVSVKGRSQPVNIVEILDGDTEERIEQKLRTKPDFIKALALYHDRDFRSAFSSFHELGLRDPKDGVFAIYAERCEVLLKNGTPPEWDGVEVFDFK
jgi:class 3 adenylate cyclase/HAMP domain-containing protein